MEVLHIESLHCYTLGAHSAAFTAVLSGVVCHDHDSLFYMIPATVFDGLLNTEIILSSFDFVKFYQNCQATRFLSKLKKVILTRFMDFDFTQKTYYHGIRMPDFLFC